MVRTIRCPNCGRLNEDASEHCIDCLGELRAPELKERAELTVIADRIYHWSLIVVFQAACTCTLLMLISVALSAVGDVIIHSRIVAHGIGYVMAFVGGSTALAGGAGLNNYTSRFVASRYLMFYDLAFKPAQSAMLATPQSYYNTGIALVVSGFVIFFYGLVLIG